MNSFAPKIPPIGGTEIECCKVRRSDGNCQGCSRVRRFSNFHGSDWVWCSKSHGSGEIRVTYVAGRAPLTREFCFVDPRVGSADPTY